MLARVADNLYWMGRYIERTEHLARFTRIQYFYSLDGPLARKWDLVLGSIIEMTGLEFPPEHRPTEAEVLYNVALSPGQPVSILSAITLAREIARGSRDLLSKELWEAINKYYHFVNQYPAEVLKQRGLHDFTTRVGEHCSIIRGSVENTLLHDEKWAFIKLGSFLERAVQVARILRTKLQDLHGLKDHDGLTAIENHQLSTVLGATEAFDMSRRYYQAPPSQDQVIEFLVLNQIFPRSLVNCLVQVETYLHQLNPSKHSHHDSVEFAVSKMVAEMKFLTLDEITPDPLAFLDQLLGRIQHLTQLLSQTYLRY